MNNMKSPGQMQKILVWFRDDLRLQDHAVLEAVKRIPGAEVVYVFVYDERWDHPGPEGVAPLGPFRKQFLIETIQALRANLAREGAVLHLLKGRPEDLVPGLCERLDLSAAYFSKGFASDEKQIEAKISRRLSKPGRRAWGFVNQTLYRPEDLPFPTEQLPMVFTQYRKAVESSGPEAKPCTTSDPLPPSIEIPRDMQETLKFWEFESDKSDQPGAFDFMRGGESAGQDRLQHYIWDADLLRQYKITRSGLSVPDDSTKLSPWLANGSLSARLVAAEVREYESLRIKNDSTYWLLFELMWRDYFQFLALKMGAKFFARDGYMESTKHSSKPVTDQIEAEEKFNLWCEGRTGYPLVDAGLRQLRTTGWMPNQVRQNAASFLVHDLGVDWRKGARWYESFLVDYDPCSNWGNWSYVAGVGTDPRSRQFNVVKQSLNYDPSGEYVRTWIRELKDFDGARALEPWRESLLAGACGYPARMVNHPIKPGYS